MTSQIDQAPTIKVFVSNDIYGTKTGKNTYMKK